HAIEHLRGDDYRPLIALTNADDSLLFDRHLGHVDLDAQIAAGDHDRVGGLDYFVEPIEGFALFDLGDDAGLGAARSQNIFECPHFVWSPHETEADEIDAGLGRPDRMLVVGNADGRHAQLGARQIDALAAANGA